MLVGGAESMHTRWRARREPRVELTWESGDDPPCEWVIGDDRPGASDYETAHLALAPTMVYPLFETALRAAAGRGVDEHQRDVSELWSRFAAVAADNPHAWSRTAYSPEEIRTVSPDNRVVCFPYPKRMCANIDVDQGAAVLLCSYEAARAAGVPDDRMVFLHAAAEAHDHWFVTERWSLAESPGDRGRRSATRSTRPASRIDDIAHFDLYSCFPSAVQIATRALGLARRRPAAAHRHRRPRLRGRSGEQLSDARDRDDGRGAARRSRRASGSRPRSVGTSPSTRPASGRRAAGATASGASTRRESGRGRRAAPPRAPPGSSTATATIEATSVAFERDGTPSLGIVTALTADGRRALANVRDADALRDVTTEAREGRAVRAHQRRHDEHGSPTDRRRVR